MAATYSPLDYAEFGVGEVNFPTLKDYIAVVPVPSTVTLNKVLFGEHHKAHSSIFDLTALNIIRKRNERLPNQSPTCLCLRAINLFMLVHYSF